MRAKPTTLDYASLWVTDDATEYSVTSLSADGNLSTTNLVVMVAGVSSGLTQWRPYFMRGENNTSHYLGFSAEL